MNNNAVEFKRVHLKLHLLDIKICGDNLKFKYRLVKTLKDSLP